MNQIRRAQPQDIPGILGLLVQVDMVHHNGRPDLFKGPATKYNAKELEAIIADDKTPVFVCVSDDGAVLGHAFCIHKQIIGDAVLTDVKTLYIDDICVSETARRMKIGSQLYEAVLAYARASGCYNVTLNVWSCNPGAQKFYESCGMKPQKIGMEVIL
ncbi:MAG: GNAT family N-acetyltransferase [Oscillospiraceae bacterium]|nr:GNAT family N-acetyltransferase [Oscillospiraceae bacterium]